MTRFFFYGTLCHEPLLHRVLGREVLGLPAILADHAVSWAKDGPYPTIRAKAGAMADGLLVDGLTTADVARLDFYEGGFRYSTHEVQVHAAGRDVSARVYFSDAADAGAVSGAGADWSLSDWVARFGDAALATAGDFMALMGQVPAATVASRYGAMLVRGASAVRAAQPPVATLRLMAGPDDVQVAARRLPYAKFFAVEEWQVAWRQFDGAMNTAVERAVFVSCDAVTVLPYDPVRDRVLLIEQFRAGPMARGDAAAWQLEAIAGRIDAGETPEQAGRREAVEEAGLTLGALLPVAQYYPSPGIMTEYLYSYVGLADLPDGIAGVFGQAEEAEDIRGHLIGFERMMELVASGEIANSPLILTALWLQRERGRLRAGG
ncbi:MAG: tellurium resistance protein [Rhodobacter sp.]|nr:tellurium resistance protein [Rhodobacter sp.]